ncbi:MAG: protein-tyrosine phosphatase [Thermoleophilaceae bacterium]|nr:protein-tyrosine phosphatase [Thermoleophilaceae bacterium]
MIDLHSHILPGLDDGADDIEVSLGMARVAVEHGVQTMAATPHVNFDYPVDGEAVMSRVGELNVALARAGIALAVLPGAEVSVPRAAEMSDDELAPLCLGGGRTLLIESPYMKGVGFLEELLFDLQLRGFRTLLAHPERCPIFQDDTDRLRRLVDRDVYCSVNTGSLAGGFGRRVRAFALDLVRAGLVHDIASDSHDKEHRPPGLLSGIEAAEEDVPGIGGLAEWFTRDAPGALIAGRALPPRPELPEPPQAGRLRRLLGRS